MFSLMLVKMPRGKRVKLQTKEAVPNVYVYFEELNGRRGTKILLNELLMSQSFMCRHQQASEGES